MTQHNIEVNFSSQHNDYYSAWRYVTKEGDFVQSVGHPDLSSASAPRTTNALSARRQRNGNRRGSERKKAKLDNLIINEAILQNHIKNTTQLLALANVQKNNGKTDLATFILDKGVKKVGELIDTTWAMENASSKLDRESLSRMQILTSFLQKPCVENCRGKL